MEGNYTQIPNEFFKIWFDLTPNEIKIYLYLSKWANSKRLQFSYAELLRECEIGSRSTVSKSLNRLQDLGMIVVRSGQVAQQANMMYVTHPSKWLVQFT